MGTPYVFAILHFIQNRSNLGETVVDTLLRTILWNVLLGGILGFTIGFCTRKTVIFVRRRKLMDEEALLVLLLMMVFFLVGIGNMLTTNELLASVKLLAPIEQTDIGSETVFVLLDSPSIGATSSVGRFRATSV